MTRPLTLRSPLLRPLVLGLLALALSACGFHLRDALLLPNDLGPLRVVSPDPYSPLAQSLSEALARAGAVPAARGATSDIATLRVVSERWGNTPLSVDQFGRAQEYTLRYAVIFRLNRADGSDLVPQQAIELSRDYIFVPTNASGAEGEREILTKELRRDMVASILRRIDAASRAPAAGAAAAVGQPESGQPASDQPASEQSASEQPASEQPASEQPASEQPASEQPATPAPEQQATPAPEPVPAPTP